MIRSGDLVHYAHQPWFDHIASFTGGLARTPVFATDQELRMAAIARGRTDHPILLGDSRIRAALQVANDRGSDRFTRFDGNLASVAAEIDRPYQISATRLQTWASCPRSYFFGYLLGVEHPEEPERRFEIDPLDRGSLVHEILEQFVREAITDGHSFDTWSAADRARLHAIAEAHFQRAEQAGHTGRELFWRRDRDRIIDELNRFIDNDSERLADGLHPVAVEREFHEHVTVTLASGHVLHLRGSVDRIDRRDDGSLEVLDYKTGKNDGYKKLSEEEPHDKGRRLQLYVYALAARVAFPDTPSVWAGYWFLKNGKRHGYSVTPQVEQKTTWAVDRIVEGIAAGIFPAHPAEQPAYNWVDCWYCTPDGLGDAHVRRSWERMRRDPALAGYLALCEPEPVDDAD